MKRYFRVFLGSGAEHFDECLRDGFVGVDYAFNESLSPYLEETWSESRGKIKPIYLANNPGKSPVGAGLSCGALWTLGKGMQSLSVLTELATFLVVRLLASTAIKKNQHFLINVK